MRLALLISPAPCFVFVASLATARGALCSIQLKTCALAAHGGTDGGGNSEA
jgi:hypothetical protein